MTDANAQLTRSLAAPGAPESSSSSSSSSSATSSHLPDAIILYINPRLKPAEEIVYFSPRSSSLSPDSGSSSTSGSPDSFLLRLSAHAATTSVDQLDPSGLGLNDPHRSYNQFFVQFAKLLLEGLAVDALGDVALTSSLASAWSWLIANHHHHHNHHHRSLPAKSFAAQLLLLVIDDTGFDRLQRLTVSDFFERIQTLHRPPIIKLLVLTDHIATFASDHPCQFSIASSSTDHPTSPSLLSTFTCTIVAKPDAPADLAQMLLDHIRQSAGRRRRSQLQTNQLRSLISSHPAHRNPLHSPGWITDALDRCFSRPVLNLSTSLISNSFTTSPRRNHDDHCSPQHHNHFSQWEFTSLDFDRGRLLGCIWSIFTSNNLLQKLRIDEARFRAFIIVIYHNYLPNPYHNIYHAVDVLQCVHYIYEASAMVQSRISSTQLFALMVAAFCHDVGHPSFNNKFLVDIASPMSVLFNDQSVLENYHSLLLFAILRDPEFDFLHGWTAEEVRRFRDLIVRCILATDMANHYRHIERFRSAFASTATAAAAATTTHLSIGGGHSVDCACQADELELQTILCIAIIKCSDISNVVRPFHLSERWARQLVDEFWLQGDFERILLPHVHLSPMNDRTNVDIATGQRVFLTSVADPLYRTVAQAIPDLTFFVDQLESNRNRWATLIGTKEQSTKERTTYDDQHGAL